MSGSSVTSVDPNKEREVLALPLGWGTASLSTQSCSDWGLSRSYDGCGNVLTWDGGDFVRLGLRCACDIENRQHRVDWVASKLSIPKNYFWRFWTSCEVVAKLIDMPIVQLLKDPDASSFKKLCSEKQDVRVVCKGAELTLKRLVAEDIDATCCFGVRVV